MYTPIFHHAAKSLGLAKEKMKRGAWAAGRDRTHRVIYTSEVLHIMDPLVVLRHRMWLTTKVIKQAVLPDLALHMLPLVLRNNSCDVSPNQFFVPSRVQQQVHTMCAPCAIVKPVLTRNWLCVAVVICGRWCKAEVRRICHVLMCLGVLLQPTWRLATSQERRTRGAKWQEDVWCARYYLCGA